MSILKISIKNGNLDNCTINLPDGDYIVEFHTLYPKSIPEWRNYYFYLRDILYENGETGYTKNELHNLVKENILLNLIDDPENFNDAINLSHKDWWSTKWLSELGWERYIKLFKEWSFEKFNCYL